MKTLFEKLKYLKQEQSFLKDKIPFNKKKNYLKNSDA